MTDGQKIVPCLWFDGQAEAAADAYVAILPDSRKGTVTRVPKAAGVVSGQPPGSVLTAGFRISGQDMVALNGGPHVSFTPALSFLVTCTSVEETEDLHARLTDGGSSLMPLQSYPFSELYGWTVDRYGLSWQVLTAPRPAPPAPCLLFVGDRCGQVEEAIDRYALLFPDSDVQSLERHRPDDPGNDTGLVKQAVFTLAGQTFRAMESSLGHRFDFTEAVSFQILCDSQEEVDHYWHGLGDGGDPGARRCGWLKDRHGISWQVVPRVLSRMLAEATTEQVERVTAAFLQMEKLDIATLERAYAGGGGG